MRTTRNTFAHARERGVRARAQSPHTRTSRRLSKKLKRFIREIVKKISGRVLSHKRHPRTEKKTLRLVLKNALHLYYPFFMPHGGGMKWRDGSLGKEWV